MSAIEAFLETLGRELRTTGGARRRILAECREHLRDAAADGGQDAAVAGFGDPRELARTLDAETATRAGVRAALAGTVAVLATGGSTLALIHAAAPGTKAPPLVAVVFFIAAQVAAVAAGVAVLQAVGARRRALEPADVALLVRRTAIATVAAGTTILAAGVGLTGHGSALLLLAGPVALAASAVLIVRAWRFTGALPGGREHAVASPVAALPSIDPLRHPARTCVLVSALAALVAFIRELGEGSTASRAALTAALEATAIVLCFLVLGPPLGLRAAP